MILVLLKIGPTAEVGYLEDLLSHLGEASLLFGSEPAEGSGGA